MHVRKTGLSPDYVLLTVPRRSIVVAYSNCLWWPFVGKQLFARLSALAVLFLAV